MFVVALLTLALPLSALAGRHGEHLARRRHSHIAARNVSITRRQGGNTMKLVDMYQGEDFLKCVFAPERDAPPHVPPVIGTSLHMPTPHTALFNSKAVMMP